MSTRVDKMFAHMDRQIEMAQAKLNKRERALADAEAVCSAANDVYCTLVDLKRDLETLQADAVPGASA